jgi:hypothetical protein
MILVYDGSSCVVKSDSIISEDLKHRLQKAVQVFEDSPSRVESSIPCSRGHTIHLIEPSLFPLIYGKSRVVTDRKLDIENCLDSICEGEVIPVPESRAFPSPQEEPISFKAYSNEYQWLPCEVQRSSEDGPVKITSYINNLHPRNTDLYDIIEELIAKSIQLWSQLLRHTFHDEPRRRIGINCNEYGYDEAQYGNSEDSLDERGSESSEHMLFPEPGE